MAGYVPYTTDQFAGYPVPNALGPIPYAPTAAYPIGVDTSGMGVGNPTPAYPTVLTGVQATASPTGPLPYSTYDAGAGNGATAPGSSTGLGALAASAADTAGAGAMASGNPYAIAAGAGLKLLGTGISAYLNWQAMKDQRARQEALDAQAGQVNGLRTLEYRQDRPIALANEQMASDLAHQQYLHYIATHG